MDKSILEDLGLSQSEIKSYVALLELGTSSAGVIIEKSMLQHSVVHRALNTLIEKGLVSFIYQGKHRIYTATEPEYFLKFIDNKRKRFETILPELKQKQNIEKKQTKTSMYKGKKGIAEVYSQLTSLSGELLTFGGSKETTDFMGLTWWKGMHNTRVANGVPCRHIASDEVLPYIESFLKKKLTSMKFLPQETFGQYQETAIIHDYVAISVFADEGYSILIHNAAVADGYRKNFEMLWKIAKKY